MVIFKISVIASLFQFFIFSIYQPIQSQLTLGTCSDLGSVKIAIPSSITAYSRSLNFALTHQSINCSHGFSKERVTIHHGSLEDRNDVSTTKALFLKDGSLLLRNLYFYPNDYCISNIKSDGMSLEVCANPCGKDDDTICVPKCCDIDKVVDVYAKGCQFSDKRWTPIVYRSNSSVSLTSHGRSALLPLETPTRVQNRSLVYKYEHRRLSCDGEMPITWTLRNLTKFGFDNIQFRFLFNGSLIYFNNSRWNLLNSNLICFDGVQNYGMNLFYTGSILDQVVRMCPNVLRQVSTSGKTVVNVFVSVVYGVVMMISCGLLSTTLLIYFLLRNKQKFHMWVVASYIISLLLLNIFFGTSNILSQVGATNEMMTGTISCILIGAATHLLIQSTFIWLTFINLNIWFTFRTLILPHSISIQVHGIKRFLIFSIASWGLPTVVVLIGLILDCLNRYQGDNLYFSPAYGLGRCLISVRSEGVFLFYPIGILLLFNAIIFCGTVIRIALYQKITKHIIGNTSEKQWKLIRIYMTLLATATILWLTEFIAWFFRFDATIYYWILIDVLNLTQSMLIFIIFVFRKNTWGNLEEKYPVVKKASMYFSVKQKSTSEKDILISKSKNSSQGNR